MNDYVSPSSGKFTILDRNKKRCTVRFKETGTIKECLYANATKGKVRDPHGENRYKKPEREELNLEMDSNSCGKMVILYKQGNHCKVVFPETGYVVDALFPNAIKGKVRDPYHLSSYGRGYLGDVDRSIPHYKKAMQLWRNVMKRCYSENDPNGYTGVTVSKRWLCFANFIKDIADLERFDEWLNWKEGDIKYNLDKDLILEGNKVYAKEFCCFIPESLNKSMGAKNMIKIHGPRVLRVGKGLTKPCLT